MSTCDVVVGIVCCSMMEQQHSNTAIQQYSNTAAQQYSNTWSGVEWGGVEWSGVEWFVLMTFLSTRENRTGNALDRPFKDPEMSRAVGPEPNNTFRPGPKTPL
jgi:hypothetical protein